jgi:hypothetical protein
LEIFNLKVDNERLKIQFYFFLKFREKKSLEEILSLSLDYERLRNEHQNQLDEINQLRKMIMEFKPLLESTIEEQNFKNNLRNSDINVISEFMEKHGKDINQFIMEENIKLNNEKIELKNEIIELKKNKD